MEMFPAIKDGDLIIGFRLQRQYVKNDVLVYQVEGKQKIGRLVARATDVVTIDEDGTLRVNGTVQSGEIMYPTYPKEGVSYPYQVPENHIFVMGDYRTQAEDVYKRQAILSITVTFQVTVLLHSINQVLSLIHI